MKTARGHGGDPARLADAVRGGGCIISCSDSRGASYFFFHDGSDGWPVRAGRSAFTARPCKTTARMMKKGMHRKNRPANPSLISGLGEFKNTEAQFFKFSGLKNAFLFLPATLIGELGGVSSSMINSGESSDRSNSSGSRRAARSVT